MPAGTLREDEAQHRQMTAARHKARHYAVQALYQWAVSANALRDIENHFLEDFDFSGTDVAYFRELLHQVPADLEAIDLAMTPFLHIAAEKLGAVERAILRIAVYELRARPDVPYRVVLNEAIGFARRFGATDSHRFVNAVLDRVAHQLRGIECEAGN